jgi:hypothetical protein
LDRGEPQFFDKKYSDSDSFWINHFVIDTLVRWEYLGLKPQVPEWAIKDCDKFLSKI